MFSVFGPPFKIAHKSHCMVIMCTQHEIGSTPDYCVCYKVSCSSTSQSHVDTAQITISQLLSYLFLANNNWPLLKNTHPTHTQPGDAFEVVPESEFIVSRTAHRDNSSYYQVNGKKVPFKEVATLLRGSGIDLDHNRFLILQVCILCETSSFVCCANIRLVCNPPIQLSLHITTCGPLVITLLALLFYISKFYLIRCEHLHEGVPTILQLVQRAVSSNQRMYMHIETCHPPTPHTHTHTHTHREKWSRLLS